MKQKGVGVDIAFPLTERGMYNMWSKEQESSIFS